MKIIAYRQNVVNPCYPLNFVQTVRRSFFVLNLTRTVHHLSNAPISLVIFFSPFCVLLLGAFSSSFPQYNEGRSGSFYVTSDELLRGCGPYRCLADVDFQSDTS